ncbi:glycosyltransferase family 4 protein [Alphaproteobacteria bacterium LSUCC0744]
MTDRSLFNIRHYWLPLYVFEVIINAAVLIYDVLIGRIKRRNTVFTVHGGAFLAPLIAARFTGIPVLWIIHETTPSYYKYIKLGKMLIANSNSEIAVVAKKAREVYGLKNTAFLPGSIDESYWSLERVDKAEVVACSWLRCCAKGEKIFRIVAVANLNPLKGLDILLDALSYVDFPFHLQVVGSVLSTHQNYAKKLEQQVQRLIEADKSSRIDFLGWQHEERVRALLASCDLFVLPSRSEACPIALLEAMSMGCSIVAADVGDVSAMLAKSSNAKIFEAGCLPELVKEIVDARSRFCLEKAGNSKGFIGPEWQLSRLAEETAIVYRKLLSKCP